MSLVLIAIIFHKKAMNCSSRGNPKFYIDTAGKQQYTEYELAARIRVQFVKHF